MGLNERDNVWMKKLNAWIPAQELQAVEEVKGDISMSLIVSRAIKKAVNETKQQQQKALSSWDQQVPSQQTLLQAANCINRKLQAFQKLELPLLVSAGYLDEASVSTYANGVSADTNASELETPSLVGRGVANHNNNNEREEREDREDKRGEWDFRSVLARKFEPTRPFGHGISNPTPYQVAPCSRRSRRPPLVGD